MWCVVCASVTDDLLIAEAIITNGNYISFLWKCISQYPDWRYRQIIDVGWSRKIFLASLTKARKGGKGFPSNRHARLLKKHDEYFILSHWLLQDDWPVVDFRDFIVVSWPGMKFSKIQSWHKFPENTQWQPIKNFSRKEQKRTKLAIHI